MMKKILLCSYEYLSTAEESPPWEGAGREVVLYCPGQTPACRKTRVWQCSLLHFEISRSRFSDPNLAPPVLVQESK